MPKTYAQRMSKKSKPKKAGSKKGGASAGKNPAKQRTRNY